MKKPCIETKMTRTSSLDIGYFVNSKNGWYKNPRKTFKIQTPSKWYSFFHWIVFLRSLLRRSLTSWQISFQVRSFLFSANYFNFKTHMENHYLLWRRVDTTKKFWDWFSKWYFEHVQLAVLSPHHIAFII